MATITVKFEDGSKDREISGQRGSHNPVSYEGEFVIIINSDGERVSFPSCRISEVVESQW